MKTEFIRQYNRSWLVYAKVVKAFDAEPWLHVGRKGYNPGRLAFHMLQSVKFYLSDKEALLYGQGKPFDVDPWKMADEDVPTQEQILALMEVMKAKTEQWLTALDYSAKNIAFPWAGETILGVVIFTLDHHLWHLGELSALLNESKHGEIGDLYIVD